MVGGGSRQTSRHSAHRPSLLGSCRRPGACQGRGEKKGPFSARLLAREELQLAGHHLPQLIKIARVDHFTQQSGNKGYKSTLNIVFSHFSRSSPTG